MAYKLHKTKKKNSEVSGEVKSTSTLYAADLGIGNMKRTWDGETVHTEPSIFAVIPKINNSTLHYYSIDKDNDYFIGEDVVKANLAPSIAVIDHRRALSENYKRMLLAFIAKDFVDYDEVEIRVLTLGLPNADFAPIREEVEAAYTGEFVVKVDGERDITINVLKCAVMPQPLGTYAYAVRKGIIREWGDTCLVLDGGAGTFDATSVTGSVIKKDECLILGAQDAYRDLRKYLMGKYGHLSALTVENMPNILKSGIVIDGTATPIMDDPEVQKILQNNFNSMYDFIIKSKFDLNEHLKVVWTGGTSLLHKDRITALKKNTFVVIENAQEANVRGFFDVAKNIDESE